MSSSIHTSFSDVFKYPRCVDTRSCAWSLSQLYTHLIFPCNQLFFIVWSQAIPLQLGLLGRTERMKLSYSMTSFFSTQIPTHMHCEKKKKILPLHSPPVLPFFPPPLPLHASLPPSLCPPPLLPNSIDERRGITFPRTFLDLSRRFSSSPVTASASSGKRALFIHTSGFLSPFSFNSRDSSLVASLSPSLSPLVLTSPYESVFFRLFFQTSLSRIKNWFCHQMSLLHSFSCLYFTRTLLPSPFLASSTFSGRLSP